MRATLQSCLRSDGSPRPSTAPHHAAAANRQCTPIQGPQSNLQWVTASKDQKYIIGDQVRMAFPNGLSDRLSRTHLTWS